MAFNLSNLWVENHPSTLANTLVVMVVRDLIYMCEVVNLNFIHILTLIEIIYIFKEVSYTWGIFAMIALMTSISKLVKSSKTCYRVVKGVFHLTGNVISSYYT